MKYRIELAATAKADIRSQAQWLRENRSPAFADKWLDGLYKTIDTLQDRPLRCPVAAESDKFPEEIHELLYGRRGKRIHSDMKAGSEGREMLSADRFLAPGKMLNRLGHAGGGDDPPPEVARRYRDLVEEPPRDRRGLAQALLPRSDRHRTHGQQLGEDLLAGPDELPDGAHSSRGIGRRLRDDPHRPHGVLGRDRDAGFEVVGELLQGFHDPRASRRELLFLH
jgi:plasmid stabilization system protein ParE